MDIPVGTILKEWQSFVTTISRNLMELSEQNDVKIIKLKAKDTINGYTGLTKVKAMKAADDLDNLWRYYALLSDVIDKAVDLYKRDSFLNDTEHEVKELLENTPITLEAERIDISNRGLLTPENRYTKVSLQELLKIMHESFESIRNTFTEISKASEAMEYRLVSIKDEICNLNNTALRLGLLDMPLFDIDRVTKVESDPLQGLSELDTIFYNMEKYKASIKSAEIDYNETLNALNRANSMLCEIEDIAKKFEEAAIVSQKVFGVANSAKASISKDVLKSLQDWLHVLQNKLSEGSLNAAKIGAVRLEQECILKLDKERESYYNSSKDYNEWQDLKGQFKALLAKMDGLKLRGLLFDSSIDVLVENIQKSLYADNVNLNSCRQLIEKFYLSLKS